MCREHTTVAEVEQAKIERHNG